MNEYECLKTIEKEDIKNMTLEEVQRLVEEMNKERWLVDMKKTILDLLDVRDASTGPRIIEAKFEGD